jgi:hypothetical protein
MLTQRNVLLSYHKLIASRLAVTTYGLANGFNVYGEAEVRAQTAGTPPAIYVVTDHLVPAVQVTLPFIALELAESRTVLLEMGSTAGRRWELMAHIFGKNLGQRDDIADYLFQPSVISNLPIYNFSETYTDPTYVETAKILHDQTVNIKPNIEATVNWEGSWRWQRIVRHVAATCS